MRSKGEESFRRIHEKIAKKFFVAELLRMTRIESTLAKKLQERQSVLHNERNAIDKGQCLNDGTSRNFLE